jgi:hypothetical protein
VAIKQYGHLPRLDIPNPYHPIHRGRDDQRPIGREGHTIEAALVASQSADRLAALDVPWPTHVPAFALVVTSQIRTASTTEPEATWRLSGENVISLTKNVLPAIGYLPCLADDSAS